MEHHTQNYIAIIHTLSLKNVRVSTKYEKYISLTWLSLLCIEGSKAKLSLTLLY